MLWQSKVISLKSLFIDGFENHFTQMVLGGRSMSMIHCDLSVRHHASTFSKKYISKVSRPVFIKFHVKPIQVRAHVWKMLSKVYLG